MKKDKYLSVLKPDEIAKVDHLLIWQQFYLLGGVGVRQHFSQLLIFLFFLCYNDNILIAKSLTQKL